MLALAASFSYDSPDPVRQLLQIGEAFGFDPFERVVDYLTGQIERGRGGRVGPPTVEHICSADMRVAEKSKPVEKGESR